MRPQVLLHEDHAGSERIRQKPGLSEERALSTGMGNMSEEFKRTGGEIYIPINKA
jgi:hypothetical protein